MGSRKKRKTVVRYKVLFIEAWKQLSASHKIAYKAGLYHWGRQRITLQHVLKSDKLMREILFDLLKLGEVDYSWLFYK